MDTNITDSATEAISEVAHNSMRSVLTIAGSDSSGGAGIQADIKAIEANQLFAQSAITALTAQNTTGVYGVFDIPPDFVEQQIDVVFDDIRPDAVKIGMVSSPEIVTAIANALRRNNAEHIVVDPVMVATSGSALIADAAVQALVEQLFPLAEVVTPNLPEAEVLVGRQLRSVEDVEIAAREIAALSSPSPAVMLKGGHAICGEEAANDCLYIDGHVVWLEGKRLDTQNTHGTGCTLSSALACGLARGLSVEDACRCAKVYVANALAWGLDIGRGNGPLNHMWEYM